MTQAPPDNLAALVDHLADSDDACPTCGYNIRGLTSDACPECGERLVLRIWLAKPKLASFIAGTAALAAGAGFGLLMTLLFVLAISQRGGIAGLGRALVFAVMGFAFSVLTILWIRARGWLRRRSPSVRVGLVCACVTATVLGALSCYAILS